MKVDAPFHIPDSGSEGFNDCIPGRLRNEILLHCKACTLDMDVYDYSFFFSTMWVGPFWFAMLVFPEHEMTKKVMQGPWFFLGPVLVWWAVTIADPQGLIDLAKDSTDPTGILDGLAAIMGSKPGASAAWAHMVAGDIFVTHWMWKRCLEQNSPRWIAATTVFFGVMMMPVGIALHMILVRPFEGIPGCLGLNEEKKSITCLQRSLRLNRN